MFRRFPTRSRLIALAVVLVVAVGIAPILASSLATGTGPGSSLGPSAVGTAGAPGSSQALGSSPARSPIAGLATPAPVGGSQAAWRVAFDWHVPVLMYHLISTPAQAGDALPGLVVAPDVFAAQLAAARAAGWSTITAATLARDMAAGVQPPHRTFVITIDDGHDDGFTQAFPILQQNGFVATFYVPTERIGHPGYLTSTELTTMAAAGMEIADHTVNHVPLASVAPTEAVSQIDTSATALAQLLGAAPTTLAYPYGSHDLAVEAEVGHAGFLLAFTTVEGCSQTIAGRLAEPRMRVDPGTTPGFLLSQLDRCAAMPAWG